MSTVRHAIDNLRYQWLGVRIGGPDATLRGQWALLTVSLLLVFGCFFAIGRLRHTGGPGPAAAPSALRGPATAGVVPAGLSGGSPIAGAAPVAIAVKPHPRPPAHAAPSSAGPSESELRAASPVKSLAATVPRGQPGSTESSAVTVQAPEPTPAPAPTRPAPVRAPEPTPARTPAPAKAVAPTRSGRESPAPHGGPARGGSQSSSGSFEISE